MNSTETKHTPGTFEAEVRRALNMPPDAPYKRLPPHERAEWALFKRGWEKGQEGLKAENERLRKALQGMITWTEQTAMYHLHQDTELLPKGFEKWKTLAEGKEATV